MAKLLKPLPHPSRWNIKKANWLSYQCHIENWLSSYIPPNELDHLELDFSLALVAAADHAIPKPKIPEKNCKDR